MKPLLICLCTTFSVMLTAQPTIPPIAWQKCIGGNKEDYLTKTSPTTDGGSISIGWGSSADGDGMGNHGGNDFLVARLDANGNKLWSRSYGGNLIDYGQSIIQTSDGGYIMCGTTNTNNNGDVYGLHPDGTPYPPSDGWLVKLDAAGNIAWQECLGGKMSESLLCVKQTADGGFITAGFSTSADGDVSGNYGKSDVWVVKVTSSGAIQWQEHYGGSKDELAWDIIQLDNGDYIFGGRSESPDYNLPGNYGKQDAWLGKISGINGTLIWTWNYGGSGNDQISSLWKKNDATEGIIAVGNTDSPNDYNVTGNHGSMDAWVLNLDANSGVLTRATCYGGSNYDYFIEGFLTYDGGFIVNGTTFSQDGDIVNNNDPVNSQAWAIKFNKQQTIDWQKTFGGPGYDEGVRCFEGNDGSYTLGCTTTQDGGDVSGYHIGYGRDYWIVKLSNCFVPPASTALISTNGPACGGNVTLSVPGGNSYTYQWKRNGTNLSTTLGKMYNATKPGTYTCVVSNGTCGTINSPNSIVSKKQTASITPSGTVNKCAATSVNFSANSGSGLTYQWYRNNAPITGATARIYTTTKTGKYKVTVTNTVTQCAATSPVTIINNTCRDAGFTPVVSTENYSKDSPALLSQNIPNPVSNNTTICYSLPKVLDKAQIIVTDMAGRAVRTFSLSPTGKGLLTVDTKELAAGIYIYTLYVDGIFVGSKRMIVIN